MNAGAAGTVTAVATTAKSIAPIVRYKVTEFAHLYDVGVGINLAYASLDQMHSEWVTKCEKILKQKSEVLLSLSEPSTEHAFLPIRLADRQRAKLAKAVTVSSWVVRIFRGVGFLSTVLLIALLSYLGFCPGCEASFFECMMLIVVLILPIPAATFCLFVYLKLNEIFVSRKLDEYIEIFGVETSQAIATISSP